MNKDILLKVDEIIMEIEKSDNYQKYLLLKDKLDKSVEIKELMDEIRTIQKDIVHGHLEKEEILNKRTKELNSIPLYIEYNNTLIDINNTFAIIENTLNNYFNNKLN